MSSTKLFKNSFGATIIPPTNFICLKIFLFFRIFYILPPGRNRFHRYIKRERQIFLLQENPPCSLDFIYIIKSMAVASSSASDCKVSDQKKQQHKNKKKTDGDSSKKEKKRTTNPGVRVIHGRIYDSENGKTCHQV